MSERLYIHYLRKAAYTSSPYNPGQMPQGPYNPNATPIPQPYDPRLATPHKNYQFAVDPLTNAINPFSYVPVAGTMEARQADLAQKQQADAQNGFDWKGLGTDVLMGTNPITGTYHFGGKALDNFRAGQWGSGLANLGWLAASFFGPGASIARGLVGGGLRAAGARMGANAAGNMTTAMGARIAPAVAKPVVNAVAQPVLSSTARSAPAAAAPQVGRLANLSRKAAPSMGAMAFEQVTKPMNPAYRPPPTPIFTGSMSETMARIAAGDQNIALAP